MYICSVKFLFNSKIILTALLSSVSVSSIAQAIYIPSGETVFVASGTTVYSESGATTINSGGTLTVNGTYQSKGNFTNSGTLNATTGNLVFSGTSQLVSINTTVKNISVTGNATVSLQSPVTIQGGSTFGTLTVESGSILTTNGNLTMQSTSSGSAIVAAGSLVNSNPYISGNVIVERHIPARRAFRILSPAVTTSTSIYNHWQEAGSSTAGYGTHITGTGGSTNGFDNTVTNNASLFTFSANGGNGSWQAVTNTNSNKLTAGSPLRILVRGDRTIDLTTVTNNPTPTTTVLRATGTLAQGTQTVSSLSSSSGDFNLVGNPFQAPVDMSTVMTNSSNINPNYYYVWDPQLSTRGAYVTIDLSSGGINSVGSNQNKYLQPGQACFVTANGNGTASVVFTESSKATSQTNVFRMLPPQGLMTIKLYQRDSLANGASPCDALVLKFDPALNSALEGNDAIKPINQDENLSIFVDDKFVSINSANLPETFDTLDLRISQIRDSRYTFDFEFIGNVGRKAYLLDRYMSKLTEINADSRAKLEVDFDKSIAESIDNQRFAIVFGDATSGVQHFASRKAKISPNPVNSNNFQVKLPGQIGVKSLEIVDLKGAVILRSQNVNGFVSVDGISNGIYLVNVLGMDGVMYSEKVILQSN